MKHLDASRTGTTELSPQRLYGVDFGGDFPFTMTLPRGRETPGLEVLVGAELRADAKTQETPLYVSPLLTKSSEPRVSLYATGDSTRLHFPDTGDFLLTSHRILYSPIPGPDAALAQIQLLGPVFSCWLEARGRPVLHASTVEVDGAAAAFLSASHGGKSSLAAALIQNGAALMSDDLLAAERLGDRWVAHPAYAEVRMWPEQAQHFVGNATHLSPVHPLSTKVRVPVGAGFGDFQSNSLPLRVIYLPQRRDATGDLSIHFAPAPTSVGLIELVRHSFLARMLHHAGRQASRLPILSDLARSVQIRSLSFPTGLEHLPAVATAIIKDVKALRAEPNS